MRPAIVALVCLAACGDNQTDPALASSQQLAIVAHQDDDHLFMQPDLSDAIRAGTPTTILYITAGDAGSGVAFAQARIVASQAAYGMEVGSPAWDCGWISILDHTAYHCRNVDHPLSLVFLGYPDGGVGGDFPHSLLRLWQGEVTNVETVSLYPAHYTRDDLIDVVRDVIVETAPDTIRTLEVASTHGDDHSDHELVGTLSMIAALRSGTAATLLAYRGYNINYEPATNPAELYDYVSAPMRSYEACLVACTGGSCGVTPCDALDDPRYANFLHRRYAVAMREPPLAGVLHAPGGCLTTELGLGGCATAADVQLRADHLVSIGERCLEIRSDGSLALGACEVAPNRLFAFDDEGHLYSALLPVPQPNLAVMHDLCIVGDSDGVRADICGADRDAQWDLIRRPVSTPRIQTGAVTTGRAVRMADLTGDGFADLCWVSRTNGLTCRMGDGTGRFGPPMTLGLSGFDIEPESLALGDIDGDLRADACGRDVDGILCVTAATSFKPVRWTDAFASAGPATASDHSLAIVEGAVCGFADGNVVCVRRDVESVLSTWTVANAANAPMWPADLDGDGRPDWCVATTSGANCGLASEAHITDDGVAWGFSNHARVEGSVAVDGAVDDVIRSAIADVSGDGLADMCVALTDHVECAVSQGHGFGPRRTMLALAPGSTITGLWLGDVDGDGKADPCVDDGTAITCAPSP